jgi:Carboxylesterase family
MCRDPPVVKIKDQGPIMGMFLKMYRTQRIVAYFGIPYAQPPVGNLRFERPVVENLPNWQMTGIRNGSISQPNCYQNSNNARPKHTQVLNKLLNRIMDVDSMMSDIGSDQYDEDCLYLNIFVPDGNVKVIDKNFTGYIQILECIFFLYIEKGSTFLHGKNQSI